MEEQYSASVEHLKRYVKIAKSKKARALPIARWRHKWYYKQLLYLWVWNTSKLSWRRTILFMN